MLRIGVDYGGTKIEAAALDERGRVVARLRTPNPRGYAESIDAVVGLVRAVEGELGAQASVGLGVPGSISPRDGRMRNANSVWLNGRAFGQDVETALGRPVRLANDANCFALSEAADGAAARAGVVFGAILGTGCGGGVVVDGRLVEGASGIGGEWGHTPLPWPKPEEYPGPVCWCGRSGCLENWVSGTGFEGDFARSAGQTLPGQQIVTQARAGEPRAASALERYIDRLGRALAVVCDILDPDVIVLGGGMSNVSELYERLPEVLARHIFSDHLGTRIVPAQHGDSSGVRGAAWLWPI
jgi:fructokinase